MRSGLRADTRAAGLRLPMEANMKKATREREENETSAKSWTFLTNHAHVLIVLYGESDLPLREVAQRVGITERAVQRIVQDLEDGGYLRHEKVGRKNQYSISSNLALRHPVEAHRKIGDLLHLIAR